MGTFKLPSPILSSPIYPPLCSLTPTPQQRALVVRQSSLSLSSALSNLLLSTICYRRFLVKRTLRFSVIIKAYVKPSFLAKASEIPLHLEAYPFLINLKILDKSQRSNLRLYPRVLKSAIMRSTKIITRSRFRQERTNSIRHWCTCSLRLSQ